MTNTAHLTELGHSPDALAQRQADLLALLRQTAPEVLSDNQINIEKLKELLGQERIAPAEHYELNWAGKTEARREIQKTSSHTLRPDANNPAHAQHMLIEGENLEVLRVLQKSYYGKVKMIYIDPPYNTGNDSFVYPDDYSETLDEYQKRTGEKSAEGYLNKQSLWKKNSKESGQYHSAWLSMMYPRLYLARNLLRDDGVIFISIDDNEAANLKLLCDEIFGAENFVAQFIWNTDGHTDNQFDVKVNHEYILLYSKCELGKKLGHVVDPNTRSESNLWKGFAENSITKNGPANPPSEIQLPIGFPCAKSELQLKSNKPVQGYFDEQRALGYVNREITSRFGVSYPIRLDSVEVNEGRLVKPCRVFSGWANINKLRAFIENDCQPLDEDGEKLYFFLSGNGVIYYRREREKAQNVLSVLRNFSTTEKMRSELESFGVLFQYPKPKELIRYLSLVGCGKDDVVLDFFAGSATTAHAVMKLNAEDHGKRQFIMVQLPQLINEQSEPYQAGYNTIAEISKERIRRAGKKILEDNATKEGIENLDIGFRILKIDSTNMKDVYYTPDALKQADMLDLASNIKEDRTSEDLLFQVMLDWGLELSLPIERKTIAGKEVFYVAGNSLVACFDDLTFEVVDEVAKDHPLRFVSAEKAIHLDHDKTNIKERFKQLSPDTEVKFL